ncbi:hypothetical protein ISF_07456 [Cordyceps fumosorosea ARSEF 2679]|uniref:Pierisin-like domain-containing protein n=1 Tax=Cordyceps fumosorosea (strain ARSEF 2679) TaxID=1081104 RepID=A0A167P873_CORFA|nr:hypothetical protein ISF_07456 [Cordyceps fumosorosea ARSEF 2679]OAA56388.1 hypothetical protein ISF_07456 [Cordyceps fumosorosea ARSEF 2679]
MQPHLLAALLALGVIAAPQAVSDEPFPELEGVVTEDGIELDSTFVVDPIFEILSNYTVLPDKVTARQAPPANPQTTTADAASKIKAPGGGEKGVFYRGDSRPPSVIFAEGFAPQGNNPSLRDHLGFAGNSGLVSLTRDPSRAEHYAFGRTGAKTEKGYVYVVSTKDVPDGFWVPGLYNPAKDPAIARNQEFAVAGSVPASSISHAYEITSQNPTARNIKVKNEDYVLKKSPSCFSFGKRAVCDPAKYNAKAPGARRVRTKVSRTFRAGARAGGAVAFAVLSPYAHDVLDLVKSWDNPIGHAVKWFDDSMASIQEYIGGPQVPEIYGNTLKLRFICWMRGEQRWPNDVDRACARLRASQQPQPTREEKRLKSINDVLNVCEQLEQGTVAPKNEEQKDELQDRCEEFREQTQEQDTASA